MTYDPEKIIGGKVVPPFDPNIKECGYCGKTLIWSTRHQGGTEESWAQEKEAHKKGEILILAWGPPIEQITYGCPDYGKAQSDYSGGSLRKLALASGTPWQFGNIGWHYFWWEENTLEAIKEGLANDRIP